MATPLKAVLRGLPKCTAVDDIKAALEGLNFKVIKITQMHSRKDNRLLPLWQLQLPKIAASKEIFKTRSLCNIIVQIEPYRGPRKAGQCFRCQGFWHTASMCNMEPRCVGCGENHDSRLCPRKAQVKEKKEDAAPPKCCNCGKDHPASFKGCKAYPVKSQFRKSYADAAKVPNGSTAVQKKREESKTQSDAKKKMAINSKAKNVESRQESEELTDLVSELPKIADIVRKLKEELRLQSFKEFTNMLSQALSNMAQQEDRFMKMFLLIETLVDASSGKIGGNKEESTS